MPGIRQSISALACAAALGVVPACGGSDDADRSTAAPGAAAANADPTSAPASLQGRTLSGRADALQLAARGVVAPLAFSELAYTMLVAAFQQREQSEAPPAAAGDGWVLTLDAPTAGTRASPQGRVAISIESADDAEGMLLYGEAGAVRAVLRFDGTTIGAAVPIDGAITLEVSRAAAGAGATRHSRADTLSIGAGSTALRWSYLYAEVDERQALKTLNVVSDVPVDGAERIALDVTLAAPAGPIDTGSAATLPAGRYIANGLIGSLNARLTLQAASDGAWTISIDNDKDDRIDFVVHASGAEARALAPPR